MLQTSMLQTKPSGLSKSHNPYRPPSRSSIVLHHPHRAVLASFVSPGCSVTEGLSIGRNTAGVCAALSGTAEVAGCKDPSAGA